MEQLEWKNKWRRIWYIAMFLRFFNHIFYLNLFFIDAQKEWIWWATWSIKNFFYQETVKITYRKIFATSSVHSLNDVQFFPITTENLEDGDDIIGEHAC